MVTSCGMFANCLAYSRRDGRIARPVEMPRGDLLALPGIEILQIGLGDLARAVLIDVLVDHA